MHYSKEYNEIVQFCDRIEKIAFDDNELPIVKIMSFHSMRSELFNSLEARLRQELRDVMLCNWQDNITLELKREFLGQSIRFIKLQKVVDCLDRILKQEKFLNVAIKDLTYQIDVRNFHTHNRYDKDQQKEVFPNIPNIDLSIAKMLYAQMYETYNIFEIHLFNRNGHLN